MTEFDFIDKQEVTDENKKTYWLYKCKHCGTNLLNADTDLLAFIWQYEQSRQKDEKAKTDKG